MIHAALPRLRPLATAIAATAVTAGLFVAGCAVPQQRSAQPASRIAADAVSMAPHMSAPTSALPSAPVSATAPSPPPSTTPATPRPTPTLTPTPKSTATGDDAPPHFATPDDAMRYLVEAYNTNNETDIRHVTTPDSRDQFEAERQWVTTFRFDKCTANGAPAWDYTCVLDIVGTQPGVQAATDPSSSQIMEDVTVLVAPAARPGYYLEANQGCGGP